MKRLLLTLMCAAGLGATQIANALTIGDLQYLGSVNDGTPSSPANEVGYINNLITLAAGAFDTVIPDQTYNRVSSTLPGPFPTAVVGGSDKEEDGDPGFDNTIDATGYQYVLGKYANGQAGSLVWYLGGAVGEVTLPKEFNNKGLSHISLYNPGNGVPDGGATVALLGLAMVGLGLVARRKA